MLNLLEVCSIVVTTGISEWLLSAIAPHGVNRRPSSPMQEHADASREIEEPVAIPLKSIPREDELALRSG